LQKTAGPVAVATFATIVNPTLTFACCLLACYTVQFSNDILRSLRKNVNIRGKWN